MWPWGRLHSGWSAVCCTGSTAARSMGPWHTYRSPCAKDPWALGIRIDHRVHVAVVLHRRSCRLKDCLPSVPQPVVRQGMRSFYKGQRAREPRVAVGIVTVVPAERGGQVLTHGLIHLNATIDGVFLVPNDAALDVEILVRKGGLG